MSLGYADRLKNKRNLGGQLGAKEYHQSFDEITEGVKSLAQWVSDAKRVFVFTGAGISTACGIPDFRGPNGIWTLRKKKIPIPTDLTPFEYAKPSFTHMVISALVAAGKVPYVCSQNVDSLHLWSGVPRAQLAELHGNCFAERCSRCRTEYNRDFQMETVDFKPSGRRCTQPGCEGPLLDNILDWDTPLPEDELEEAVRQAEDADVALVLGTSLQIQPANEIPTLTRDEGGRMVIVNLQKTPKDRKAALILRSRVDLAMALLVQQLGMTVPPYVRTEQLVVEHELSEACPTNDPSQPPATSAHPAGATATAARDAATDAAAAGSGLLTVRVRSRHGRECPMPMVESLRISVAAAAAGDEDDRRGDASGSGRATAAAMGVVVGSARAEDGVGTARVPLSSNLLASPSPSTSSGGGGGGGFAHSFHVVPPGLRFVRCTLHVRLVKWADEDKRDVVLQHTVDLHALAHALHAAPDRGGATAHETSSSDGFTAATTTIPTIVGNSEFPASAHPSGPAVHCHTFVSQEVRYDPAQVVAAFLANPPPVTPPDQPKKKRLKAAGAESADAASAPVPAPTRVSQRLAASSSAARKPPPAAAALLPLSESATPTSPSLSASGGEDGSGSD